MSIINSLFTQYKRRNNKSVVDCKKGVGSYIVNGALYSTTRRPGDVRFLKIDGKFMRIKLVNAKYADDEGNITMESSWQFIGWANEKPFSEYSYKEALQDSFLSKHNQSEIIKDFEIFHK